jgi:predicted DNA-binding transcriptional regulator AlpA
MTQSGPRSSANRSRVTLDELPLASQNRAPLVLPDPMPRRGLRREMAAQYVGVSPSKFDDMVADGRMPQPKFIDRRLVWDLRALDAAFDDLPDREDPANLSQSKTGWEDYQ